MYVRYNYVYKITSETDLKIKKDSVVKRSDYPNFMYH